MSNTLDDIRKYLSEQTGIPEELITGNDANEMISRTGALCDYVNKVASNGPTRDQFAAWFNGSKCSVPENLTLPGNKPIEQEAPAPQSTRESFAAWFNGIATPKQIFE